MPIRLKHRGTTIKVHCDYQTGSADKSFWKEVANRVQELKILEERQPALPGGSETYEDQTASFANPSAGTTKLPRILVNLGMKKEAHECKCPSCNPGYEQQREQDIQRRLREDFESNTRAELLETTLRAIRESIDKDATHAVHEEIRSQIFREEIATRKDQLRQ